jgi:hypothetical protein
VLRPASPAAIKEMPDFLTDRDSARAYREPSRTSPRSYETAVNRVRARRKFGMRFAEFFASGEAFCTWSCHSMRFLEGWWERAPMYARVALFVISILGMILGGSASGYWD